MNKPQKTDRCLYGIHAVQSLLHGNAASITSILVHQDRPNTRIKKLLHQAKEFGIIIQQVTLEKLDKLASGKHQGIIAIAAARNDYVENDLYHIIDNMNQSPLLLVLDGVTDPHNLGACLRSADAAGVNAIIVPKDNSAPLTDVATKVSSGAAETVPLIRVTNLARTLRELKQRGLWITGLDSDTDCSIYDTDLSGGRVLVMGSEGQGMRRLTKEHCDELVSIPMQGYVSSLNVSVAAGICLFEAVRQRNSSINTSAS